MTGTARLLMATPTSLATWQDCPRRYRLRYLEHRASGPAWAHISWGLTIHAALRAWWDLPPARRVPQRAPELVAAAWVEGGFRDQAQAGRWRERAAEAVRDYVTAAMPAEQPPGIERTVGTTTPVLALSGRIDRLDERAREHRDGEPAGPVAATDLVVVDYKTSRRVPSTDDARGSLALAVYAAGARRVLRRPCTRVELHHVPSGAVVPWEHDEAAIARHLRRADMIGLDIIAARAAWAGEGGGTPLAAVAEALGGRADPVVPDPRLDAVLPPLPGRLCPWCDLRRWCPEGQEAGPAQVPWAGLPEAGADHADGEGGDPAPPAPDE